MSDTKRIVEINGVKIEVDLRDCKVIENYKVGDQIKVLIKLDYSTKYKTYPGVIVGFDDFKNLPGIQIAYLEADFSTAEVKFLTFNGATEGIEIAPLNSLDKYFSKAQALEKLDKQITAKQLEIEELEQKRKYFESTFHKYFEMPKTI